MELRRRGSLVYLQEASSCPTNSNFVLLIGQISTEFSSSPLYRHDLLHALHHTSGVCLCATSGRRPPTYRTRHRCWLFDTTYDAARRDGTQYMTDALTATETQSTYMALKQPPLRPPPAVFGPMWTALYGFMGFAAYRAWTTAHSTMSPRLIDLARHGATLYTIQLGLNLIWMPLFFRFKRPIEASVDIVALTGVTAYLTYIWSQVDEVAGWALAPYVAWLGFASYLCVSWVLAAGTDWNELTRQ